MSPVFDTRLLSKRWFHMPAFAVIAAAASLGIVGVHAIDAWKASKQPRAASPEPSTTTLIGRASIDHIKPDHVAWSLSIIIEGKHKADVERALVAARQRTMQQLHDSGITDREIRLLEPSIDERTAETNDYSDNAPPPKVLGYDGTQGIEIRSTRVTPILDAYSTISLSTTPELTVPAPECWVEDLGSLRQQVQEAALQDIVRQRVSFGAQLGGPPLGKLASFTPNDVDIVGRRDAWACSEGLSVQANAVATYWLK